ncbi:hypothetical protein Tco_0057431 [Tanacetum coccineum]
MEPRPERVRETTPVLRFRSPRARRQRERVVKFEEVPNKEWGMVERNSEGGRPSELGTNENRSQGINLPLLLAAYLGRSKSGQLSQSSLTSDYPLPDGLIRPSYVSSYDGKGDPDIYLHIFKGAIRMQKWEMPVSYHMFTYTFKDSARLW